MSNQKQNNIALTRHDNWEKRTKQLFSHYYSNAASYSRYEQPQQINDKKDLDQKSRLYSNSEKEQEQRENENEKEQQRETQELVYIAQLIKNLKQEQQQQYSSQTFNDSSLQKQVENVRKEKLKQREENFLQGGMYSQTEKLKREAFEKDLQHREEKAEAAAILMNQRDSHDEIAAKAVEAAAEIRELIDEVKMQSALQVILDVPKM